MSTHKTQGAFVMSDEVIDVDTDGDGRQKAGSRTVVDGDVNVHRFSIGPVVELSYRWWNRRVDYQVRREPSNHEVLVTSRTMPVWDIHIALACAISVVLLLYGIFSAHVGFGAVIVLVVVFALVVAGVLSYERYVSGDTSQVGSIVRMDAVVWETIKQTIEDLRTSDEKVSASVLDDKVNEMLRPGPQELYASRLYEGYHQDHGLLEVLGKGVRSCQCQGCRVMYDDGYAPERFGAQTATSNVVLSLSSDMKWRDKLFAKREAAREEKIRKDIETQAKKREVDVNKKRAAERRHKAKQAVRKARRS